MLFKEISLVNIPLFAGHTQFYYIPLKALNAAPKKNRSLHWNSKTPKYAVVILLLQIKVHPQKERF